MEEKCHARDEEAIIITIDGSNDYDDDNLD